MKFKPLAAAATVGVGAMAFASPALALPGDDAILSQSPFRLNPLTLEPGCKLAGAMDSTHLNLTYLATGEIAQELHISVANSAPFSVDQVLVPSKLDGYALYGKFDTGHDQQRRRRRSGPDRRAHVRPGLEPLRRS